MQKSAKPAKPADAPKYEWRKTDKDLYLAKPVPTLLNVPKMKFFIADGTGSPESEEFQALVQLLYTLSYTVRMLPKSGWTPIGYREYTVFPLEGLWSMETDLWEPGRLDKTKLRYRLMIRQPGFVTGEVIGRVFDSARKKLPADLLERASFRIMKDGRSVQMLHVGPYDTEPETFAAMNAFLAAQGLSRTRPIHREIYLSDPRKVAPEKNRTTIRYIGLAKTPARP